MTNIEPLYDKKCTCLLCHTPFTSKKVRSRFVKVKKYDSDFLPYYGDHNPLYYYINVCPSCGFSYCNDSLPAFSEEGRTAILEKVCLNWNPHSFSNERNIEDSISTHKLAAYCAILRKDKHVTLAGFYLRIAWHYRINNCKEQESRFLNLALYEYEQSYSIGDFRGTAISELRVIYLIADLSKRTGKLEQATKYYSKVIERQNKTTETQIVKLAKEGWQSMRESQQILFVD
ncbi:MAG TPA: DUF2225 domain-containing protein [Niallia sp.]|nr:DUF2225 domain-containing protein [Niallia sp.]